MTGRERKSNIFNFKPSNKISWTILVDDNTRSIMPKNIRNPVIMDFYRKVITQYSD